jgi:hypothetical protein
MSLQVAQRLPRTAGGDADDRSRRVTRHLPQVGLRAAVGALCIAVAAVAVLVSWQRDTSVPTTSFVYAQRDLVAGEVLTGDAVSITPADLGSANSDRLITSMADADGLVVTGPIAKGTFLTTDRLVSASAAPASIEVALELPSARALGGALRRGDTVSVLASGDVCTSTITLDARISDIVVNESTIGQRTIMLRLALSSPDQVAQVVNADQTGKVTLARGGVPAAQACEVQPS